MSQLSVDELNALKERLAKNPGVILEGLAEASKATPAQLIECLPETMWWRINGERFIEVMGQIATWGDVTVIVHTADVIMEFLGPLPEGEQGHGFYNLKGGKGGLHGHLRHNRCVGIYFVERPFMAKATASVQFVNEEGGIMFKIYVGRDEQGELRSDQMAAFRALAGEQ